MNRMPWLVASLLLWTAPADAHDPIFGLGPHVLYKGGIEIAPEFDHKKAGDRRATDLALELTYGLTGDWSAGIKLPYVTSETGPDRAAGMGNLELFTKYRFWRNDMPGVQESAAVAFKLDTATGTTPAASGSTDALLGLAYGYESRKWYRWASLRWRYNGVDDSGLRRGDRLLLDLVGGVRLKQTGYLEPDTVWLLELNGEYADRAERHGAALVDSGGTEWFVSPGIFWTLRNFAVKAGVQIPVASDLNGRQPRSDYRARLVLEWHL